MFETSAFSRGQIIGTPAYPPPALRAAFSCKGEKGCARRSAHVRSVDEARGAPALSLAAEGWAEGTPRRVLINHRCVCSIERIRSWS